MRFVFGPVELTEAEIIRFGEVADPLRLHTDLSFAKASRFGGLIASGLHPFTKLYTDYFLPMAEATMVAGLNLNASFHQPVFPAMPFHAEVEVAEVRPNPAKGTQVVVWRWQILDAKNQPVQTTVATILHSLAQVQ